jgi:hypothetical protein
MPGATGCCANASFGYVIGSGDPNVEATAADLRAATAADPLRWGVSLILR